MSDTVRTWRHIQQRYNLVGSKCTTCGQVFFPQRVICPDCRRKGNVAIIELEEGAKVTAQIVDADVDDIQIGDPVEMVFRKIREDGPDGVISYGFKFKIVK